jgi:putative isomerase
MYRELLAMDRISKALGYGDRAFTYSKKAERLRDTINRLCWDERNGFYYSVDLNLLPIDPMSKRHSGAPRNWDCLIQKIDVWSGLLPMWAGITTKERAERIVKENLLDTRTFCAEYGIRSLARTEQMYQVVPSGNPSCWLGPVWILSNYLAFEGMLRYGFEEEAVALAKKTVELLGNDLEESGDFHEYYDPDTGAPIFNQGFQSWNFLVINMIACFFLWRESSPANSRTAALGQKYHFVGALTPAAVMPTSVAITPLRKTW